MTNYRNILENLFLLNSEEYTVSIEENKEQIIISMNHLGVIKCRGIYHFDINKSCSCFLKDIFNYLIHNQK